MLIKTKKIYGVLVFLIIILLLWYFFWPQSFQVGGENQISFKIYKDADNRKYTYILNKQEANDFAKLLDKSKLYHGVTIPKRIKSNKILYVRLEGGLSTIISIYYDTNKTYVFAQIPSKISPNYRISNEEEIKQFIEKIVDAKNAEFMP
ncbi:MAG: hypothetical protein K0R00_2712 [Herbinix sp.]|nr:hypothetical protein [Herbinix sp.]